MEECLRQIVANRRASVKKDLSPNALVFTRRITKVLVSDAYRKGLAGVHG